MNDLEVLECVRDMLQHGIQPRIVNVTPELVAAQTVKMIKLVEANGRDVVPAEVTRLVSDREAQWDLARQADQEVEYIPQFLVGTDENLGIAVDALLLDRLDTE